MKVIFHLFPWGSEILSSATSSLTSFTIGNYCATGKLLNYNSNCIMVLSRNIIINNFVTFSLCSFFYSNRLILVGIFKIQSTIRTIFCLYLGLLLKGHTGTVLVYCCIVVACQSLICSSSLSSHSILCQHLPSSKALCMKPSWCVSPISMTKAIFFMRLN